MENVLTAVIVIFLFLFAGFTLSETLITSQDTLAIVEMDTQSRNQARLNTSLKITRTQTKDSGQTIQLDVLNDGQNRLYQYDQWDVIIRYTTADDQLFVSWVPYTRVFTTGNQWTIEGLYTDSQPETFDLQVLNPGETIVIVLNLSTPVKEDTALQFSLCTENGYATDLIFPRNALPELVTHVAGYLAEHQTITLTSELLYATDADDLPDNIRYVVETAPQQGSLSHVDLTQQDIDANRFTYTHTGSGNDSFTFSITDGKDAIGSYTFHIFISDAPTLTLNMIVSTTTGGTAAIYNTYLKAEDIDDTASELTYTVVAAPIQGQLSLGTTFTQADIDAGLLTYTHTGFGSDHFNFTISDGETIIGPFVFMISVV